MHIKIIYFKSLGDDRGSLISLEANRNIPFEIKRVYYIYGTKQGVARGFHAHKDLEQVLVCVSGSCTVLLDDGHTRKEILLDHPDKGLVVSSLMWREMYDFSEDCVLLVLASDYYDESDYIRDYQDFIKVVKT